MTNLVSTTARFYERRWRRSRSLLQILFLVGLAVLGACASDRPNSADPNGDFAALEPSARQVYFIEQEAIAECMRARGFEYRPPPFVDWGTGGNRGRIELAEADTIGYGGVWRALELLTPGGAPATDVPDTEYEAYVAALNGSSVLDHDHSDGADHDHDTPQDHDHGPYGRDGCYSVGRAAVSDVRTDLVAETESLRLVVASDDYEAFAAQWHECLAATGVEVRSTSPTEHASLSNLHFHSAAAARLQDVLERGDEAAMYYESLYRHFDELDAAWFDEVASHDDALTQLLAEELRAAGFDAECRAGARHLIAEVLAELES